ncbi:hypothetical protein PMI40_02417, partial [Herbaspirillum sp. YR522]
KPLAAGDKLPLTLTFEKAGRVEVTINVEDMAGAAPAGKDDIKGHAHH